MPTKHISKNGQGKITSKVTKPKDWAFRTPSEGRPKSVHSRRAKPVRMVHEFSSWISMRVFLLNSMAGTKKCAWKIYSLNPNRILTPQDVLDFIHAYKHDWSLEVAINREFKLLMFDDISQILTGGHEDSDSIPTQLTKKEIEIGKHHVVPKEAYPCKKCGKYGPCKCGPKFNKCNGFTSWELICALAGISIFVLWTLVAVHFIHKFW